MYSAVADTLKRWQPEVVVLNCCAAETIENGRLIMDAEDVHCVAMTAPNARLYLTHLDNVAHAALTRHTLKGSLAEQYLLLLTFYFGCQLYLTDLFLWQYIFP